MRVPFRFRTTAALTAAVLALAACGESDPLPTTFEPAELEADVLASEAAFSDDATSSLLDLGLYIDNAILSAGGVAITAQAALVMDGAQEVSAKLVPSLRLAERSRSIVNEEMAAAIPVTMLGKTFEWDVTTDAYVATERTGAPTTGVRFILYAVAEVFPGEFAPAEPLVERGHVDIVRETSGSTTIGRLSVVALGGTTVMEYEARVGGTQNAPTFSVDGFAGTGANQLTFELNAGVNLLNGTVTTSWLTEIASRGLRSTVELALGEQTFTLYGLIRRGVRKIEMNGTINFEQGGTLTVRVGNRVYATITFTGSTYSIVDADGNALSAEQEETLFALLEWFEAAFFIPDALLSPLYTVLDVE